MYFVYALTLVILIFHLYGYLKGKNRLFRHTFLDWPLILFLISQVVSTYFSIDRHTSIFGYYSRMNGGLFSLLAYTLLYWVLAVHITKSFKKNLISVSLSSGFLVAAFGIAQHFGIDKDIWVQDVQTRVFSTLGQPNWLAAYLCVLLPLAVDKFHSAKTSLSRIGFLFLVSSFYLCLLFTKSKSGIIAALVSISFYLLLKFFQKKSSRFLLVSSFLLLILLSLSINNPLKDFVFPPKVQNPTSADSTINITPSGDIRKIVWKGAFQLWQQFPLFGTGPETFAYSYYWVRPAAHNLTSEWDFLYNKAHNEYLNYLATTGSFGLITYFFLIGSIIFVLRRRPAALFAFFSILITNAAGFSVVIISIFFFLLPSFSLDEFPASQKSPSALLKVLTLLLIGFLLFLSVKNLYYYLGDIAYSRASTLDNNQKYSSAYHYLQASLGYRPNEPVYLIKGADLAAKMAIVTEDKSYVDRSLSLMATASQISPFSLNLWKQKAQVYYYLSTIDSNYYLYALDSLTKATKLAPTDAKSFYMLAEFYQNIKATDQAIANYQAAINLKSNYDYAYYALGKIYFDQKQYDLAKNNFEKVLTIAPGNLDAQDYLSRLATASASLK